MDPLPPRAGRVATHLTVALLAAAVTAGDYLTGTEISFSGFYLLPVLYATRKGGLRDALPWVFLCAALWFGVDRLGGHFYSHPLIPLWNALVRGAFFALCAYGVSRADVVLEKEREVSALKSSMLSAVSHEFGNSLTIMNMCLFLLKESDPADAERRRSYFDLLEKNLRDLKNASGNFLNQARMESGKFALELKPADLRELVLREAASLEIAFEQKKVALVRALGDAPVPVRADPEALALVVRNLLGNALKYTPFGGEVTVALSARGGSAAEVSVRDDGIGIPPEDLRRIATGFYRAEGGRKAAAGYGVGLKVTQDLLAGHGSRLEIESEPGKGSRFSFVLPVETPSRKENP